MRSDTRRKMKVFKDRGEIERYRFFCMMSSYHLSSFLSFSFLFCQASPNSPINYSAPNLLSLSFASLLYPNTTATTHNASLHPILPLPYPTLLYPTLPYPTLLYSTLLSCTVLYSTLLYPTCVTVPQPNERPFFRCCA